MEIVELTWSRVIRFWWAAFWRSFIFANLFAGVITAVVGIALRLFGHKTIEGEAATWVLDGIALAWIPGFVFATRYALRLRYRDFRFAIIRPESSISGD